VGRCIFAYLCAGEEILHTAPVGISQSVWAPSSTRIATKLQAEQKGKTCSFPCRGSYLSLLCTFVPHSISILKVLTVKRSGIKHSLGMRGALYVFMARCLVNHRWQLWCSYCRDLNHFLVDHPLFRSLLILTSECQPHGDDLRGLSSSDRRDKERSFRNRNQPTCLVVYLPSYHKYSHEVVQ
jgi:hypothetical protein